MNVLFFKKRGKGGFMEKAMIKGSRFGIDMQLGYTIETLNNIIFAITFPGDRRTFQVGQKVASSSRIKGFFPKRGVEGIIVKIDYPSCGSSDIIHVLFRGFDHPHMMKPKDLI